MELNYINEFVVLSQILKFQEAADILYISQSSLSKHIKAIETELGQDLFIRSKKNVALSDFGKAFLPYATQIANIQKDYSNELLEKDPTVKTIVLGYIPIVTLYTFMKFFSSFAKLHPYYKYSFIQGSEKELIEWLQQKKVDFILINATNLPENQFNKRFYTSDSLVTVLPEKHRLAKKKTVSIKDLNDESFIQLSKSDSLIQILQNENDFIEFKSSFSVDKENVLFEFVKKNLGISVLTKNLAEHFQIEGTVIRNIDHEINFEIFMVYSLNKPSAFTKAFSEYLESK